MVITLIGFMGTGKTTIGQQVADKIGFNFIDLDVEIENKYGKIKDIFATKGEDKFRDIESETLKNLGFNQNIILATGGGVVVKPCNMEYLRQHSQIVWINSKFNDIIKRLQNDKLRPLWDNNNGDMKAFFDYRNNLYNSYADIEVYNESINDTVNKVIDYVYRSLQF